MKTIGALTVFAIILSPFVLMFTGLHLNTGNGEHTGYVTAVERNGLIFKTGRVYIKTDTSSSQEDEYCVTDPSVYAQLEELSRSQSKVTVKYHSWLIAGLPFCKGEPAVINSIK
jgi:hypothetical protein